jgi:hypothetical protein
MASRGAQRFVAFERGGRALPFEAFDLALNRPDIVAARLGASADVVAAYENAYKRRVERAGGVLDVKTDLDALPTLRLVDTPPQVSNDDKLAFRISASASGSPLARSRVVVNGVPEPDVLVDGAATDERALRVKLGRGKHEVVVRVEDARGRRSLPRSFEVVRPEDKVKAPRDLYLLAIGVSDYADDELDLQYAAKDAADLVKAFPSGNRKFGKVKTKLLTDREVTREGLKAAARHLEGAGVDDVVVVFVASHGFLDDNDRSFFGTSDIDPNAPSGRGLPYDELQALFSQTRARRRLVLLDTCHSGEVDLRRAGASRIVLAVPVGATSSLEVLGAAADDVVCVMPLDNLRSVGEHYDDFTQVENGEVLRLLEIARRRAA